MHIVHRSENCTVQLFKLLNNQYEVTVHPREFGSASRVKILTPSLTRARDAYLNAVQEDLANLNG